MSHKLENTGGLFVYGERYGGGGGGGPELSWTAGGGGSKLYELDGPMGGGGGGRCQRVNWAMSSSNSMGEARAELPTTYGALACHHCSR